ncbi:MAG: nucleoside hydrolase [Bryobacteraceae bacterium]
MQSSRREKPPLGVVFDSDMGSIDDALALGLLYGFDGKGEARVAAVSLTRSNLSAAAFCEAVGRFYVSAAWGRFAAFARTLPIGLSTVGPMPGDQPMFTSPLAKLDAEGAPVYKHDIREINDTAEVTALIRNALTAQHDQNSIIVLTGPATNLAKVLDLSGAKDLIASKVRFLSLMGGAFPDGDPESNIKADIAAAKKLFAEWPTPIVASGYEIGETLQFPASGIEGGFSWAPSHPIVDAYRAHKPMPYDAPAFDMTAVLYAVRPQEGYFKLSDPGTIGVLDDGRTNFTPSAEGKHRYLIFDPEQKDRIVKTLTEVASAKPAPRRPRRLQQQEPEKKQPESPQAKPPSSTQ